MANRNILNMSREIENINKNIAKFERDIRNLNDVDIKLTDLNEIKMNKLEAVSILEKIKDDFTYLEKKVDLIDNSFKNLISNRNIDFVNNNINYFEHFLINQANLSKKKTQILIYAFECKCAQDFFLLNEDELIEFGFHQSELNKINEECKKDLESHIYTQSL
jgi:hypothetical protein